MGCIIKGRNMGRYVRWGAYPRVGFRPARRQAALLHQVPQHGDSLHGGGEGVPQLKGNDPQAVQVHLVVIVGPGLADLRADVEGGTQHP